MILFVCRNSEVFLRVHSVKLFSRQSYSVEILNVRYWLREDGIHGSTLFV